MKCNILTSLIISLTLLGVAQADTADQFNQPNYSVTQQEQSMIQGRRTLSEQRDAFKKKLKEENAQSAALQAKMKTDQKKQTVTPVSTLPAKSTETTKTCNCYDLSNPDNYASNFLYSQNNQRLYRINPHCQCEPAPPPTSTVVSSAPTSSSAETTQSKQAKQVSKDSSTNPSTSSSSQSTGAYWGVQY